MAAATIALPTRTPPPAPIRRAWREPAWWLFAVLITFGLVELFVIFGPGAIRHPAPLLFATVLFGLHGAFLIWILRRLDYLEPEPIALLATALAWGGIVATVQRRPGQRRRGLDPHEALSVDVRAAMGSGDRRPDKRGDPQVARHRRPDSAGPLAVEQRDGRRHLRRVRRHRLSGSREHRLQPERGRRCRHECAGPGLAGVRPARAAQWIVEPRRLQCDRRSRDRVRRAAPGPSDDGPGRGGGARLPRRVVGALPMELAAVHRCPERRRRRVRHRSGRCSSRAA